jgi:hypothetical protein
MCVVVEEKWPEPRVGQSNEVGELPRGVAHMATPWQPLNVLIAAEQALASGRGN